jgi:Pvc16 N-terminal domain
MLYNTLKFICGEVNKYLNLKMGIAAEPRLKMGNIALALDNILLQGNSLDGKAVLSIVNVEEDKVAKQQENYTRADFTTIYKNPPLYLNVYVLFSINKPEYDDCIQWLGHIMQFFQHQQVFTPTTHPDLDAAIPKVIVDLYSMSFEQVNHLWSTLGGKYMPSVLYKIRQVTLDENVIISESGFIKEIELNQKMKTQVAE